MRRVPTLGARRIDLADQRRGRTAMAPTRISTPGNRLLDALPNIDQRRVLAQCDEVELSFSRVLSGPGTTLEHVYFQLSGFISAIMPIGDTSLEVGLIGSEGMFGMPLALCVKVSPMRAVVQGEGSALRMRASSFCLELARSGALRREIDRYVFVRLNQLAQMAGCMRFHVIEARLARWLLMTQDRARAETFHMTQEFLALMLGVRRVGVTKAARSLQERKLIRYTRGKLTVLDRRGLKAASCRCYDEDRRSYRRILGYSSVTPVRL
jgi:CRP-like cAMP-binding protein